MLQLTLNIFDKKHARALRKQLSSEHLGFEAPDNFDELFAAFQNAGHRNLVLLKQDKPLLGRVVFMAPKERLELLLSKVYYPNKLTKALYKLGYDTEELVAKGRSFFGKMRSKL